MTVKRHLKVVRAAGLALAACALVVWSLDSPLAWACVDISVTIVQAPRVMPPGGSAVVRAVGNPSGGYYLWSAYQGNIDPCAITASSSATFTAVDYVCTAYVGVLYGKDPNTIVDTGAGDLVTVQIAEPAGITGSSGSGGGDANDPELYVPEDANGQATVELTVGGVLEDANMFVRWIVQGNSAEPNTATGNPVTITFTPNPDRTFLVTAGVDEDLDGDVDWGSQQLRLHVVKTNIQVDSNNNGQITADDDAIEANAPGKIFAYNNDYDNGDGNNPDCNVVTGPVSSEDDLVHANLAIVGGPPNQGEWSLLCPSPHLRVWREMNKTTEVVLGDWYDMSALPSTVYLEGIGASSEPGGTYLTLYYDPTGGGTTAFSDTVRLTVGKVEFTTVTLPNGFLGTLDDDPNREDYGKGIRQQAETKIKLEYRLPPQMDWSCDNTSLYVRYTGRVCWNVGGPNEPLYAYYLVDNQMPGARGDASEEASPNVVIPWYYDGIQTTASGARYELVLKSTKGGIQFWTDPNQVTAKPLVGQFTPNQIVASFCPYTTPWPSPRDHEFRPTGDTVYWGVEFRYVLNASLVGHDFVGSRDEVLAGNADGLEVSVTLAEGDKWLRVIRDQKKISATQDDWRYVKWECYDTTVDEPGGEPYFPGLYDYPQTLNGRTFWGIIPEHVGPEGGLENPYRVRIDARGIPNPYHPECQARYWRWGIPVRVEYDLENE